MSFEMMEALLVEKIAALRASEAAFARSLSVAQNGVPSLDLNVAHQRMHAQLHEVEQLIAAMEIMPAYPTDAVPALLPIEAAQPLTPSAWM